MMGYRCVACDRSDALTPESQPCDPMTGDFCGECTRCGLVWHHHYQSKPAQPGGNQDRNPTSPARGPTEGGPGDRLGPSANTGYGMTPSVATPPPNPEGARCPECERLEDAMQVESPGWNQYASHSPAYRQALRAYEAHLDAIHGPPPKAKKGGR